ncbi:hypothetical protein [Geminisphaera colitermitum]|uniref:hypothetical protein n=1 Tax=Geminisphaera colitermitum TaxID=1148786 RepID=UPI0001965436|nr:hypothetical protein [Geminisphaera colitermitum]
MDFTTLDDLDGEDVFSDAYADKMARRNVRRAAQAVRKQRNFTTKQEEGVRADAYKARGLDVDRDIAGRVFPADSEANRAAGVRAPRVGTSGQVDPDDLAGVDASVAELPAMRIEPPQLKVARAERSKLREVVKFHEDSLKQWKKGEGKDLVFQDDGEGGEIDTGPLAGQMAQLEKDAGETVGFLEGAFTSAERGQPTEKAKAARAELDALAPKYEALKQKRQRMLEDKKRAEEVYGRANQSYGKILTDTYGVSGDNVESAVVAENAERAVRGEAPIDKSALAEVTTLADPDDGLPVYSGQRIGPNEKTTKLRKGYRREVDGQADGTAIVTDYPLEAFRKTADGSADLVSSALSAKVGQRIENGEGVGIDAEVMELDRLRKSGVKSVDGRPIDDVIGEKGGEDAVNDATLWNSVRRLEKRIAGIDVEMPGANDARKKSLADMRAVYSRTLAEKRGLMDQLAGRGEGFWGTLARTGADALKSFASGGNALLKMVGDIYGLATGDFDNAASRTGKEGMEFWQGKKSDRARMLEGARSQKVDSEEGWHRQAWAYIRETASNPALLANVLAEQAPNFVGTGGVGTAARVGAEKLLLRKAVTDAAKLAAATRAARIGVGAAVGAEVAMQGADVAGDFYADFMQRLEAMPEGRAKQIPEIAELMEGGASLDGAKLAYGLAEARKTAVLAGGISGLTKFLPGAQTIEKTLVGGGAKKEAKEVAKKTLGKRVAGAVGGAGGEATSEAVEEGGGQVASNLMAKPVDPERPLMKGVGEAVGQAVVTAGLMGGGAGFLNGGGEGGATRSNAQPDPKNGPTTLNWSIENPDTGGVETVTVSGATDAEARQKTSEMFPMLAKYEAGAVPSKEDQMAAFTRAREVNGRNAAPAGDEDFSPEVDDELRAEMGGEPGGEKLAGTVKRGDIVATRAGDFRVLGRHEETGALKVRWEDGREATLTPDTFGKYFEGATVREATSPTAPAAEPAKSAEIAASETKATPAASQSSVQGPAGGAGSAPNPRSGAETGEVPAPISTTPETEGGTPDAGRRTQSPEAGETPAPQPAPAIRRGENKPAHFVKTLVKAVGMKGSDRASRFLLDFAPRLHRANPEAFEQMEVHTLDNAQWTKAETGSATPDSAAAYNPETNTLYINTDRVKTGEDMVRAVVHEGGHFAEAFALGNEFAQNQWESLTDAQREASAMEYNPGDRRKGSELKGDISARSEWVAFQFARVIRGDTDQMNPQMRTKLQRFLTAVRDLVRRWYSKNQDITTAELDRKILEVMGFSEDGKRIKSKKEPAQQSAVPSIPTEGAAESPVAQVAASEGEFAPGPVVRAILENRPIDEDFSPVDRIRENLPDADETLDPDAVGGANSQIVTDDPEAGNMVSTVPTEEGPVVEARQTELAAETEAGETPAPQVAPKPAKKPRAKKAKGLSDADRAENFFRADRVIPRAGGGFDKVVDFTRGEDGNWSVTVWRVNKDGSPIKGERLREHSTFPDERALQAWEKENPAGKPGMLGSPAVGQTLREADATMVEDKGEKPLLDTANTNAEIIKLAAIELKSWPESVKAADGSGIDMRVADKGSMSARVWHLIRESQGNTLHRLKAGWLPRVPETLKNAQVRLVDERDNTRVFVRKYEGGIHHAVVVRPDGSIAEQRPFEGSLTTQFPVTKGDFPRSRQQYMRVDWVHPDIEDNGLRRTAPKATPPDTTSGSGREEFRQNPDTEGGRGQVLGSPAVTPPAAAEMEKEPGPGREFSRFPDSLRDRGQPVEQIEYDVRHQEDVAKEAKRIIKDRSEAGAEAMALDRGSGLNGDVRVGIIGELMGRRAAELKDAKTPADVERITRELNRLAGAAQPTLATEAGQQIAMFAHMYRDQRVAAPAEYVKAVHTRQNNRMGKAATEAVDGAADELNKASRKAVGKAAEETEKGLRTVKVSKAIWQQYREDAAQKMVDMVDRVADEKSPKSPLQEFAGRIVKEMQARMEGVMPKTPEAPEAPAVELLREAMANREKYGEVFETVRETFVKEFGEGSPAVREIDLALANIGARPYSDALLDRAIREAHRTMRVKVRDLARQHMTRVDVHAEGLAADLVKQAGLTGADADRVAAEFTERVKGMLGEERRKALKQMKERIDTPKARRVLNVIERSGVLNNLGALSRADMRDVVAKQLKLPEVTPGQMKKIAVIADRIETAPNSTAKARAQLDLLDEMRLVRGVGRVDIAMAFWYANLLSGYTTQLVNATGNAMLGALQLASVAVADPKRAGDAVRGYLEGAGTGFADARSIMGRGFGSKELVAASNNDVSGGENVKTGEGSNVLEIVARGDAGGRVSQAVAKPLRYVYRVMRAIDSIFYHSAREAHMRVAVAKLLEGKFSGAELRKRVRESLGTAPDQLLRARRQAEAEGFSGHDLSQRVFDLMQEHRVRGLGTETLASAVHFGLESTYNQKPEGWAGVLAGAVSDAAESFKPGGVPVLKAFLPFLKVPTNVFNTALNFTPVGLARARLGVVTQERAADGSRVRREFNSEERARLAVQSIAGSVLLTSLGLLAYGSGDDDEEPWFSITASGPSDYRHRQQLEGAGWRRNTIKLGKVRIPYQDSPLNVPLALVGSYLDALRYGKEKEETVAARAIGATLGASRVIFDTSMLSGMGQLMDMVQGKASPDAVTRFLASVPSNALVPGVNLMRQVDRTINPKVYETDGPLGATGAQLPFVRATGSVKTDILGEEVERSPLERFVHMEEGDPLREVLKDKKLFITVPSKSTKLGNRQMTDVEYRHYVQISGRGIARRLRPLVPALRRLPAESAEKLVTAVTREERDRAKAMLPALMRQPGVRFNPFDAD